MASDYYFQKWKRTLENLKSLIQVDLEYQETKIHDQERCYAARRIAGVLGMYISLYNEAVDCLNQNIQVQKTVYMTNIVTAIAARINELKGQLRKLEGAFFQYLNNGLLEHKLTPCDAEFSDIPKRHERSEEVKNLLQQVLEEVAAAKKKIIVEEEEVKITDEPVVRKNWWEDSDETHAGKGNGHMKLDMTNIYKVAETIPEEISEMKQKVATIQAHEKTRRVIQQYTRHKQRRELWEKELKGILNPPAPQELRERSAKFIQKVLRRYFILKRTKLNNYVRDELLNISFYEKPTSEEILKEKEMKMKQSELYKKYEDERKSYIEEFKQCYLKKKRDDIAEEIQIAIREWFRKWYDEVRFFQDIPKEKQGGSLLILKEEVMEPWEWSEKYEAYLNDKKANKNKTALQLKWEKQAAKEEEMTLKREEMKKKKLEADLLKKMMKNPTLHPGYNYPISKKVNNIIQAINEYDKYWHYLDQENILCVKKKFIKCIEEDNVCMEVKLETSKLIDPEMREELKILRNALREEYLANEEQMPEPIKEKPPRKKKQRKLKVDISKNTYTKLKGLVEKGVLKQYAKYNLKDFLGDSNYAGDDMRCKLEQTYHLSGETRSVWWEKCQEVIHGFRRILLVGPKGSGKETLIYIMATLNDAVLYELNPSEIPEEHQNSAYLEQLVISVAICAKATQPSVIYIKNIDKLYYKKTPPEEIYINFDLIKRYFIRKLFRKIHKHDNITVIGTSTIPWLTKSKAMLKKIPITLLMPHTCYSTVYYILWNWQINNRIIPRDLDIHSLAYVLQGYSFDYLVKALEDFLTAERIINIAAHGLTPQIIYDYFLEDESESKVDYEKYIKWYTEQTHWGKIEKRRIEEDKEFKRLVEEWKEKMKKKKTSRHQI